jgi:HK97 gp10 family phage protein
MAIKGVNEVIANLKRVQLELEKKRKTALTRIGVIVKGDAVKNAPVDTGNLRNSSYFDVDGSEKVFIGFTASYAPFVHENLEATFKKGGPKFLEKAVKQNPSRIIDEFAKGGIS